MGLFGKSQGRDPKDLVQEWTGKMRKESRQVDRQIRGIQREEEKVKQSLKAAAKKGDKEVCTILAKEIVRARKATNKLYVSKAQINSVILSMRNQLATVRMAGTLQKSTEVMQSMQKLIKVPEIAHTMQEMSKEMMRAGIIEEMMEDAMSGMEDQDELEEEAQEEVDKVLWEITAGQLGKAPAAVSDTLPSGAESAAAHAVADSDEDDGEDVSAMQERLAALRS